MSILYRPASARRRLAEAGVAVGWLLGRRHHPLVVAVILAGLGLGAVAAMTLWPYVLGAVAHRGGGSP